MTRSLKGNHWMQADVTRTMYDYSDWAMEKVLGAADGLTLEQLNAPGTAGRGSVRETLFHLIRAHHGWLSMWDRSMSPGAALDFSLNFDDLDDFPDINAIRAYWHDVSGQTIAFTSDLSDGDMARAYAETYENGETETFILWQMMVHVVNHGTQHRSEVAAMLTDFGHSPGNIDMIFYFFEQAEVGAAS